MLTGAEPAFLRAPMYGGYIHLRVPVRSLSPLVASLDTAYGRPIPAESPALQLLTRYISMLDQAGTFAVPELRRQAVIHILAGSRDGRGLNSPDLTVFTARLELSHSLPRAVVNVRLDLWPTVLGPVPVEVPPGRHYPVGAWMLTNRNSPLQGFLGRLFPNLDPQARMMVAQPTCCIQSGTWNTNHSNTRSLWTTAPTPRCSVEPETVSPSRAA